MSGERAVVDGNDEAPKASGATWSVEARVEGNGILVDFSSKGGPKELLGKFDGSGIAFTDGNRWEKMKTPAADSAPAVSGGSPAPSEAETPVQGSASDLLSASG